MYFYNTEKKSLILTNCRGVKDPLGLKDELIRWAKITVTTYSTFLAITQEFIH